MNKHYLTLELDKVLQMLKNETSCDDAAELALEVKPSTDFGDVCRMLNQTEDAASLLERFGAPSFGGLVNVNNALARAAQSVFSTIGAVIAAASAHHLIFFSTALRSINILRIKSFPALSARTKFPITPPSFCRI